MRRAPETAARRSAAPRGARSTRGAAAHEVTVRSLVRGLGLRGASVRAAARRVLRGEAYPPAPVSLVFLGDDAMAEIHGRFKGRRRTTDVLSCERRGAGRAAGAAAAHGERETETAGEVIVSVDRARAQAAERRLALDEELARLVIHGLLHLAGYDHRTSGQRKRMRAREDYWMRELARGSGWLAAGRGKGMGT